MTEVRTYMPFTFPVNPVSIQIIPDMDLSYALASTLVEWDGEKQISAGLAESWKVIDPKSYRFKLRSHALWSDGTPLTSTQIKSSFNYAMKEHAEDLRSLVRLIDKIECPSDQEIDFKLTTAARESGLLSKLTEPNFGVLKVRTGKGIDLSITTGPFSLNSHSNRQELILDRNTKWHRYAAHDATASRITIRRTPQSLQSQNALLEDSWPNLMETSSLIKDDLLRRYETAHYSVWKRPLDKLFYMHLGKRSLTPDGRQLLRFLRQKLSLDRVVSGLSGYTLATGIFPRGYQLHVPDLKHSETPEALPNVFKQKPLEILISPTRVAPDLQANIRNAVFSAVGVEPHFIVIPLEEMGARKSRGDFDLYAGTIGLADPDPEGIMSYYVEGDAPLIPSQDTNFVARLDAARAETVADKKLIKMRDILRDAVLQGYVLPLFHLSTVGLGRNELDFSRISTSDESVTLSKIRFRGNK